MTSQIDWTKIKDRYSQILNSNQQSFMMSAIQLLEEIRYSTLLKKAELSHLSLNVQSKSGNETIFLQPPLTENFNKAHDRPAIAILYINNNLTNDCDNVDEYRGNNLLDFLDKIKSMISYIHDQNHRLTNTTPD